VIVLDFAKIDVYHHSFQIIHVICYFGQDPIRWSFAGGLSERNDLYFVVTVWLEYLLPLIDEHQWKSIEIWTDGGPKHFKLSGLLTCF
jgi:hypothetical protein